MPIRLNLLAEAQALEELRRRDPVKRAVLVGVVLLVCTLIWSSSLMFQKMAAESNLTTLEANINSNEKEYKQILENEKRRNESQAKLAALNQLATNRFLVGNLLNALQKCVVDNVQLVHMQVDQKYVLTEAVKAKTNDNRSLPKPATATEKIALTLEAKESGPGAGDAVSRLQEALSRSAYFQDGLKTNGFRLKSLGSPQQDPAGQTFVLFTLEAHFPDKTR